MEKNNSLKGNNYNSRKLAECYNYHSNFGAVFDDIIASQYGIKDGRIINPARHYFFYKKLLPAVAQGIGKAGRLADIGCGIGLLTDVVLDNVEKYVGTDISLERLKQAQQRNTSEKCAWVVADAQHLPFKDNSFNAAVSLEVIEHVPDPAGYLCQIQRVLKPKAKFILSTPGSIFYSDRVGRPLKDQHIYQFNLSRLKVLLKKNFFTIVSARGIGLRLHLLIPVWIGSDVLKRLYVKMKKVPLKSGYGFPISLEFDIVTHPGISQMYFALKSKRFWYFCMRMAGVVGKFFPEFSSTMVVECRK